MEHVWLRSSTLQTDYLVHMVAAPVYCLLAPADFFYFRYTFDDQRAVFIYADPLARQGRVFSQVSEQQQRQQ
jgi:hypothetical protein